MPLDPKLAGSIVSESTVQPVPDVNTYEKVGEAYASSRNTEGKLVRSSRMIC